MSEPYEALIEQEKQGLLTEWAKKDRSAQEIRAERMAVRRVAAAMARERDQDPLAWVDRMGAANVDGLALTWPGCGAAPNLGVPRTPYGFSIAEDGWHYKPEHGERQFVCSPVVPLAQDHLHGRFSVLSAGKWKTVTVPQLARGNEGRWHEAVILELQAAGLRMADRPVTWTNYSGETEREQPHRLLGRVLFGLAIDGGLGTPVIREVSPGSHGRKGLRNTLRGI